MSVSFATADGSDSIARSVPDGPPASRLATVLPIVAASLAGTLAVIVLVGWAAGSRTLTSLAPSLPTMKLNTAVAFGLSAIALTLSTKATPARSRLAELAGLVVLVIAVLTLLEWLTGRSLGIDELLVHDPTRGAGRSSPVTALAFALLAIVQLTDDVRHPVLRRAHLVSLGAFALTVLTAAAGYLYGSDVVTGRGRLTGMAVTTMAGLMILLVGVISLRPERGPLRRLWGQSPDAVLLRRLVPAVLIVPPVLGFLRLLGQDAGWYDTRFGLVLFTISMMVVFAVLLAASAGVIGREDGERRRAATATHSSERRFRTLARLAPVGIFEADRNGVIVYINERACEISGRPASELVGSGWAETAHPDDRERIVGTPGAGGGELAAEYRVLRPDGTVAWVTASGTPARGADGAITGYLGTLSDVTALKEAEWAARDGEARMQALLDHAPMPMSMRDGDGRFVLINQRAAEIMERSVEDILRARPEELMEPAVARALDAQEARVRARGRAVTFELVSRDRDGHDREYFVTKYPVTNAAGEVVGVGGISLDVTERRQLDAERQAAEQRFRLMVESVQDYAILMLDVNGNVATWNLGAERFKGYAAEEIIGRHFSVFYPDEDVAAGKPESELEIAERVGRLEDEGWRVRKDGTRFWANVVITALRAADGSLRGYGKVTRDLTERRVYELELRASREEALEASRLKSEFVANMSHEIRTPLNGVVAMCELLLGTELDGEQAEYAGVALTSAEALMRVINDILDFSKIEAGRLDIVHEDYSIEAAVGEVCGILGAKAHEKRLELAVEIDGAVPPVVRGDGHRVHQVLVNLVGNAVKFTAEGEVVVSVAVVRDERGEEQLQVEVSDTGIGIASDKLAMLFQPFTQADTTTTRQYGGSGLGLSIARQLVELMGGRIGARAAPVRGSVFWFTLPCERGDAIDEAPVTARDLTGSHVLIVDDNATNRRILEHQLSRWGLVPDSADGAEAALELMRGAVDAGRAYEIALIDMHMPGTDGLQLARTIKANPRLRSTRLIMLSSSPVGADEARAAGIEAALSKPVRQSRLYDQLVSTPARAGAAAALRARPAHGGAPPEAAARHVLVAEDNEINQFAATQVLRRLGFSVDIAGNGREAVDMSARREYAAVFMDCQMPEIDGYTATAMIRRREAGARHTPIIAMTSHTMDGDREKCLDAGMDDYIAKPLRIDVVAEVCGRRIRDAGDAGGGGPGRAGEGAAAPGPPAGALFDPAALEQFADPDQQRTLIGMFVEQLTERMGGLEQAIDAGDPGAVHAVAHGLKGSAATIGALAIAALCDEICVISSAQSTDGVARLHRQLLGIIEPTNAAMEAHLDAG